MASSDPLTGLQYVQPTDPVASIATIMEALADGIAAAYAPPLALSAGWSTLTRSGSEFRLLGTLAQWLDFTVTRSGAPIAFNATGGGVTDVDIGTLSDAIDRPLISQQGVAGMRAQQIGPLSILIGPGGIVSITSGPTSGTIATADTVRIQGLYFKK